MGLQPSNRHARWDYWKVVGKPEVGQKGPSTVWTRRSEIYAIANEASIFKEFDSFSAGLLAQRDKTSRLFP
jgi:hypothetical protein